MSLKQSKEASDVYDESLKIIIENLAKTKTFDVIKVIAEEAGKHRNIYGDVVYNRLIEILVDVRTKLLSEEELKMPEIKNSKDIRLVYARYKNVEISIDNNKTDIYYDSFTEQYYVLIINKWVPVNK